MQVSSFSGQNFGAVMHGTLAEVIKPLKNSQLDEEQL